MCFLVQLKVYIYIYIALGSRLSSSGAVSTEHRESFVDAMVGDPLLSSASPGDLVDIVVQVLTQDVHAATLRTLWHDEQCRCTGHFKPGAVLTLYGIRYQGVQGSFHSLQVLTNTTVIERKDLDRESFHNMVEVCAGIGGIASGCQALGGECHIVQEANPLACAALRLNFPCVLEGSLANAATRRELHEALPRGRCIVAASLPKLRDCIQGLGVDPASTDNRLLHSVLQLAWTSQASGIVLVTSADPWLHPATRACIEDFAAKAGYQTTLVKLDLAFQWASSRIRWWLVLLPNELPKFQMLPWPKSQDPWLVQHVIPEWPVWPDETEAALVWDEEEAEEFSKHPHGQVPRMLESTAQAPPALHSWGNALRPCPCGCRPAAFDANTIASKGLPGTGIISAKNGRVRHLHPSEAGLLNALSPAHRLPQAPRDALCLVGCLTSPLQAIWVLAHLRAWAAMLVRAPPVCPLLALDKYRKGLLQLRHDLWLVPSLLPGGRYELQVDEDLRVWQVPGPLTAGELIEMERATSGPGILVRVLEGQRQLGPGAFLRPHHHGHFYTLMCTTKRARRDSADAICQPTTAAALATGGPKASAATSGTDIESGPQLERDLLSAFDAVSICNATPCGGSPASVAPPCPTSPGCTDTALWCGLTRVLRASAYPALQLPPTISEELLHLANDVESFSPELFAAAFLPDGHCLLAPFLAQQHWTLLVLRIKGRTATAEVLDGIPGRNTDTALKLAELLCTLGSCCLAGLREESIWLQEADTSCGAIVLAHARHLLVPGDKEAALAWANAFVATLPALPFSLIGWGGLSSAQEQELQRLLISKGVPEDVAGTRLQAAVAKLGSGPLAGALSQKNVWQALKAAASRPGTPFKWVQPDELQAHIEQKAQTRFGTEVKQPRAKKQRASRSLLAAPLHVDPDSLLLSPGSFTSKSGNPLGQLSFAEVQACATGVCFCSVGQAMPFLAAAKNLSVDALALVTTAEVDANSHGHVNTTSLRFPALYAPTQEAILVTGTLIQLGDEEVQLAVADIAEVEKLSTVVCRLSVFRDECKIPWDKFAEAPIRALLQSVPEYKVCKLSTCDSCSAFHAAVDEEVENLFLDIWARQWCRLAGGRVKPSEADVFQAFVRLPSSALPHAFRIAMPGIYLEPRASDGSGPHSSWAVVWLPGATASQALHYLRTTEKAIALTRLGSKYGVRTKEADEQQVFEALRPQHQFLKVRVAAHYRLHPLPHGYQRTALVQQLKVWGWNGKPLQPDRGDAEGSAWLIGASTEPPLQALPLGTSFVLATKVKEVGNRHSSTSGVCASMRTRKALLKDDDHDESTDPWADGKDPWSTARASQNLPGSSTEAVTKIAQLETGLRQDLKDFVQQHIAEAGPPPGLSEQDKRLHALETSIGEMRHQSTKSESWFQGFGTKVADQAKQIDTLTCTVQEQRVELGRVQQNMQSSVHTAVSSLQTELTQQMAAQLAGQMEQITALFADKKARH